MHKILLYAAYGWLTMGGLLHFAIDVVSQDVGGKRAPSPETTLDYGMNTAYALSQVLVGLIGLWLAWRAAELLDERPLIILCLVATAGWLAIDFVFIEYWEPKAIAALFGILVVAAAVTA